MTPSPTINIELPSLLAPIMQGELNLTIKADTLDHAFKTIIKDHNKLGVHLFNEQGQLREHVLCFWNGTNTRWLDDLNQALKPNDTLMFMQAVSGG
jgi:adenylyltransferase/sulfurtransferase